MADAEKLDEARMDLKLPPLNVHLTQGMLITGVAVVPGRRPVGGCIHTVGTDAVGTDAGTG